MTSPRSAAPAGSAVAVDHPTDLPEHIDVVVVGAGLSGIGAGYRLQQECPDRSYLILEARQGMGGTWDLFRYPGIRSDSDMFTLGFPFKPWDGEKSIADGSAILDYIHRTAAEHGIDRRIRYRTKVVAADWSSADARWTLTLRRTAADGSTEPATLTCDFLYACAGYYDYDRGHSPEFEGAESFGGRIVHPQFWPEDLDWSDRRVVVIGSGATAVTLVPSMAEKAAHVTMLQRTPTWIGALPARDAVADALRKVLPERAAYRVTRGKNILFSVGFYQFCRRRPQAARKLLTGLSTRMLRGDEELVREHLTPRYDPWDQRLCAVPDGDLFKALRRGQASIVTDHIDRFVPEGIRLKSGRVLEADVVVTATGLQLLAFGGVSATVDGEPVDLAEQFVWNGAMLTGLPNFAFCIGYTNASWTLRADLTSRLVCKVLTHMRRNDYAVIVPRPDGPLSPQPLLDLAAGYVQRSISAFPRQGDRRPWQVRQNYILDATTTLRTRLGRTLAGTRRADLRARDRVGA